MSKVFRCALSLALYCLSSTNCIAYTLEEVVRSGFIDAGVFMLAGGLAILLIPRLTKLGIIFMLLGDLIILARIFFGYDIIDFLDKAGYGEFFIGIDSNEFKTILWCTLLLIMILLGLLGALKNWLWKKFWGLFGFYKDSNDRKEKKCQGKEKHKNKHTKRHKCLRLCCNYVLIISLLPIIIKRTLNSKILLVV